MEPAAWHGAARSVLIHVKTRNFVIRIDFDFNDGCDSAFRAFDLLFPMEERNSSLAATAAKIDQHL